MELCWLTTDKCNQNCRYCDRFQNTGDLARENYMTILDKLIRYGVKYLTFGGGESLILSFFGEIVNKASQNGVRIKLVTNGELIPVNSELIKRFDEITLSIDSPEPSTNKKLGRGEKHFDNVCLAIEAIKNKNKNAIININSVVTKINIPDVVKMGPKIMEWNVSQWRIFRFCPLRETALKNRNEFEISEGQFDLVKESINNLHLNCRIQFKNYTDMENEYLLITPDGKLCVSRDLRDVIIGDMITDDLRSWFVK